MTNVIQLRPTRTVNMDAISRAIDAGVRTAFSQFTNEQVKELVMSPYRELAADMAQRKAA